MALNPKLEFDQLQSKCIEIYATQMKENDGAVKYYQELKEDLEETKSQYQ